MEHFLSPCYVFLSLLYWESNNLYQAGWKYERGSLLYGYVRKCLFYIICIAGRHTDIKKKCPSSQIFHYEMSKGSVHVNNFYLLREYLGIYEWYYAVSQSDKE